MRAAEYDRWLERLRRDFTDRVLPVTAEIAEEWGRMNARRTFPVVDGLLGATALVHGLVLVTRNVDDVRGAGVRVLNPFSAR